MTLAEATLAYGRDVMTALLGLDRLYRRESGDEDGLAVLDLSRPGEFTADDYDDYQQAGSRFGELDRGSTALLEADRRTYYADLCRSSLAFIAWRQHGLAFDAQLRDFLHVPAEPAAEQQLTALGEQLKRLLDAAGYHGDLAAQCVAWEARNIVAGDDVPTVLTDLLNEAWDRTNQRLLPIPADRADGMRVTSVSGVSYNARCDYLGRSVELNTDPILTRPGLKHLAVHEGYPGHYLQFKLRQVLYDQGRAAADGLLSVVNTASSSVFEGIADHGMALLDWADGVDDQIQALLNRYRAGIGTGAAWRLHVLGWTKQKTADWLAGVSLTGGPGWVANRLGFISSPARAVLIWSYWWGEPVVAAAWNRVPPEQRPAFVEFLYGRMHSNNSVAMFGQQ